MTKNHLSLSESDKSYLESLLSKGKLPVKVFKRASALLALDRHATYQSVATQVGVTLQTISTWCSKYHQEGLSFLQDKPRQGRPREIDGLLRAKVSALACSDTPEGYEKWSLRLLADRAVALGYCDYISYSTVRDILKKRSEASSES